MLVSGPGPWHANFRGGRGQCHRGTPLNMLIVGVECRSVLKAAGSMLRGVGRALVAFDI